MITFKIFDFISFASEVFIFLFSILIHICMELAYILAITMQMENKNVIAYRKCKSPKIQITTINK